VADLPPRDRAERERFQIFPVYGTSTTAPSAAPLRSGFRTQQVLTAEKAWPCGGAVPLYCRVGPDTERGWGVLPPFF